MPENPTDRFRAAWQRYDKIRHAQAVFAGAEDYVNQILHEVDRPGIEEMLAEAKQELDAAAEAVRAAGMDPDELLKSNEASPGGDKRPNFRYN